MPVPRRRPEPSPVVTLMVSGLVLAGAAVGATCAGAEVTALLAADPGGFALAVLLATATAVPYTAAILWADRHEKEPPWLLLAAFLWGAVASTALAGAANTLAGQAARGFLGDEAAAMQFVASFVAPITEETTKAAALLALFSVFRAHADDVLDGVVYGAVVGMGFAWFENIVYYALATDQGFGTVLGTAWVRGVLSGVGTHASFTGLTGVGFGLFRVLRRGSARWFLPPAALALAIFGHFAWNTFSGALIVRAGGDSLLRQVTLGASAAVLVLQAPFVVLLGGVILGTWAHQDHLIRRYLALEPRDVVSLAEVERLVPARRRVVAGVAELLARGPVAWWRHRRLTMLLIRLAFERWHHEADALPWPVDRDATVLALRARIRALRARGVRA